MSRFRHMTLTFKKHRNSEEKRGLPENMGQTLSIASLLNFFKDKVLIQWLVILLGWFSCSIFVFMTTTGCTRPAPEPTGTTGPRTEHSDPQSQKQLTSQPQATTPFRSIISLAPSLTEILFTLGVGEHVKGVTRYCVHPPQAQERAVVGGFNDLNVEMVLGLEPDLVVCVPSPGNRDPVLALRKLGLRVLVLDDSSVNALLASIRKLGVELGLNERGRAVADKLAEELAEVGRRAENLPSPRTMMVLGHRPLVVAGPGSLAAELITLAGGELVPDGDNLDKYVVMGMETLLGSNPDQIIDASGSMSEEHGDLKVWWARWQTIPAVSSGNVHILPDPALLRPGINLADNANTIAARIHGSQWENMGTRGASKGTAKIK